MVKVLDVCVDCTDLLHVGDKIWENTDTEFCPFCDNTPTCEITVEVKKESGSSILEITKV